MSDWLYWWSVPVAASISTTAIVWAAALARRFFLSIGQRFEDIGEQFDTLVGTLGRIEAQLGVTHQPPGALHDLSVLQDKVRDARERLIVLEVFKDADRRQGPPDRRTDA